MVIVISATAGGNLFLRHWPFLCEKGQPKIGSDLANATDLCSGEVRFTIGSHLVISVFNEEANSPDRGER